MEEITQDTETSAVSKNEVSEGKLFSQEQINEIVSSRLKQVDKKYEERIREIVNKERIDAERLAKLTAEEKEKELISRYKSEIEAKEKALRIREAKLEATALLNEKQIPIDLADFVLDSDIETMKINVEKLDRTYKKAVEKGINEKLKGKPIEDFGKSNIKPAMEVSKAF
jgi:hypothetical protein